ncbi:hypothetical protein P7K49_020122 [Saguinus oedipus]|uniref:Uncharacterized protein n=1 Tax=Saguinus oedipus TaxID=9490 RepID=A0ABQ9UZH2_SAGOE|nr:hypothetical protein P7K49_020122 [Saguinus oedipus]
MPPCSVLRVQAEVLSAAPAASLNTPGCGEHLSSCSHLDLTAGRPQLGPDAFPPHRQRSLWRLRPEPWRPPCPSPDEMVKAADDQVTNRKGRKAILLRKHSIAPPPRERCAQLGRAPGCSGLPVGGGLAREAPRRVGQAQPGREGKREERSEAAGD